MKKILTFKNILLIVSIILNLYLGAASFINNLNEPSGNYGILTQDINLGNFGKEQSIFKLPKGITVQDVSPRGFDAIGQFENNRYSIIITTELDSLVKYDSTDIGVNGNFYSADYPHFELRK